MFVIKRELHSLNDMKVNGHVVNLVSSPVNVTVDFSNNFKYSICWKLTTFECNRRKVFNNWQI